MSGKGTRPAKFYPADDLPVAAPKRTAPRNPTKLRASITPGTVLILLAGRFKGKRVVFLGQLPSGLLLVTGPFKLNGVPLRRVSQAYVIATSTKLNVSGVDISKYNDAYFKATEKKQRTKRSEEDFFEEEPKKTVLPAEYVANQKAVDAVILGGLDDEMKGYLSTRFTLRSGDRPHLMKF
jgi:large subunit ribosomal protein L6e